LAVFQSERVASAGGRKGVGEIPPALKILGEISSNFLNARRQKTTICVYRVFYYKIIDSKK